MMNADRTLPHDWFPSRIPENVKVDDSAYIQTTYSFQLFRSGRPDGLRIGKATSIYLGVMFDFGPNATMSIGSFALLNGARIICDAQITVGDYCLISWNVVLMDTYRFAFDVSNRRKQLEAFGATPTCEGSARPINIGNNVWIGFDTCVLPGVQIGDGSVVGARSVVAEDVPPMTVVAGNPARVIRKLA
jgi:acetyltransferase-like isoleucine patch superfamily enzyme